MPVTRTPVFTVAQVNRYLKRLMEDDALLTGLFVEGELSNVKAHSSGHVYFTLKDEQAAVSGVMFKSYAQFLPFLPENGLRVVVGGYVSLYEKTGQYQLYAERMEPAGIGSLQAAYRQLCERLRNEGLFDPERKRLLPAFPRCVAIVTSPTGAALRDMLRVIRKRNPAVRVVVAPALVQGADAAADIARAIGEVNAWAGADVIIVGRGGGSAEDLWAFNEETAARAVAASAIPVISAVGHETDTVITDFAADERAPTPTAAAMAAVFDLSETINYVRALTDALHKHMYTKLRNGETRLRTLTRRRSLQKPLESLYQRQIYAQNLLKQLNTAIQRQLSHKTDAWQHRLATLERVSPYTLWARGFVIVRDRNGQAVTSVQDLTEGESLTLAFKDGEAEVMVTQTHHVKRGSRQQRKEENRETKF